MTKLYPKKLQKTQKLSNDKNKAEMELEYIRSKYKENLENHNKLK